LADAVDVYVEDIAFTVEDLATVAAAAREQGLQVRCHADQLGPSGAAEAAAELGVRSADHLNHVSKEGVRALGGAETAAVLLPVSTMSLRAQPPPVTDLLAAGAAVALATDFNPGTSPCLSMPEVLSVAASVYRIPVLASLVASSLNPACVLAMQDRIGSLEPGKRADFVVVDTADPAAVLPVLTWCSCPADELLPSTDPGWPRLLHSDTTDAAVYWTIMNPEFIPGRSPRKPGRPLFVAGSSRRYRRRPEIEASPTVAA